jgi:hypothetical protein
MSATTQKSKKIKWEKPNEICGIKTWLAAIPCGLLSYTGRTPTASAIEKWRPIVKQQYANEHARALVICGKPDDGKHELAFSWSNAKLGAIIQQFGENFPVEVVLLECSPEKAAKMRPEYGHWIRQHVQPFATIDEIIKDVKKDYRLCLMCRVDNDDGTAAGWGFYECWPEKIRAFYPFYMDGRALAWEPQFMPTLDKLRKHLFGKKGTEWAIAKVEHVREKFGRRMPLNKFENM